MKVESSAICELISSRTLVKHENGFYGGSPAGLDHTYTASMRASFLFVVGGKKESRHCTGPILGQTIPDPLQSSTVVAKADAGLPIRSPSKA